MNKRSRRKMLVAMVIFGVAISTVLALTAFDENLLYFYSPTQIHAGEAPENRSFRVGGLVVDGSVRREENSLAVQFDLTDNAEVVAVTYTGILPDMSHACTRTEFSRCRVCECRAVRLLGREGG